MALTLIPGIREWVEVRRDMGVAITGQHEGSLWGWKCSVSGI